MASANRERSQTLKCSIRKIVDEKDFLLSDGTKYKLSDCEFERYNFKFKDVSGNWKAHKERERIDKKCFFADNIET